MALTFTTGMTLASAADSATNWTINRIAGSGQAPTFGGSDATVFKQGTASNSSKISVASTDAVQILDWYTNTEGGKSASATVNLSTSGNEVVCGWVNLTTISAVQTFASGGLYLLISSSTEAVTSPPTVYSKWYIGGSNKYAGGWVFFMVDTRKTASTTAGGGCNLAAVRRIGVGVVLTATPGTIKADNLFVDAIWYGRPNYKVIGDASATVATWSSFLTDSTTTLQNGLIERIGSTFFVSSGIEFGDASQANSTIFTDATAQKLEFKRYTYYNSGEVDSLNYADYYIIKGSGATSFRTSITLGSVVGTGDNRQGVLGGSFSSPDTTNLTYKVDFQSDKVDLSAVNLYGFSLSGAKGGVLLDNNSSATESNVISCSFVNSGEVDPGSTGGGATMLSCNLIDPLGGTSANRGLIMNSTTNVKKLSCITSGTPATQHLTRIPTSGTASVAYNAIVFYGDYSTSTLWHGEASAASATITINASNSANPDATEFEKTGAPAATVTVSNPTTLTIEVRNSDDGEKILVDCEVTVVKVSDESVLFHEDGILDGTTAYDYNSGSGTAIYINVLNVAGYQNKTVYQTLSASSETAKVFLDTDRIYAT